MFRSATSRLTSIVLAAGLMGLAVPLMGAGPQVKLGGLTLEPPRFGRLKVEFGRPQRPELRRPVVRHVEMPCELNLSAFQSGNTVIVVATGTNRESGFVTRFEACDLSDRTPEVHLINERGHGPCAQVITAFEATGSFNSRRQVSCLKVHIGNHVREVRVVQTPCL